MENEIWKPIKGFEGLYEVSNLGRVRSLDRTIITRNGKKIFYKGKILKPINCSNGYLKVNLVKNKKQKTVNIHRLVAETFIPNPNNKPCVDHINTIRTDNRVENLRWATASENQYNELTTIRKKEYNGDKCYWYEKIGKNNPFSKKVVQLTLEDNCIKIWDSASDTGRNGFLTSKVAACCRGERKTHKGFKWMYYEDYIKQIKLER